MSNLEKIPKDVPIECLSCMYHPINQEENIILNTKQRINKHSVIDILDKFNIYCIKKDIKLHAAHDIQNFAEEYESLIK